MEAFMDNYSAMLLTYIAIWVVARIICGIIAVMIGWTKRYATAFSFLLGLLLGIIGIIVVTILQPRSAEAAANSEALVNYKKLLDNGGITQEEFETKKMELLTHK